MQQKEIFLNGEADAWQGRHLANVQAGRCPPELVLPEFAPHVSAGTRVLEIGCGQGERLLKLKAMGAICSGIDPSEKAVRATVACGLDVRHGTADCLPFDTASFDIVIFGFCLYVCDPVDWPRIAAEADRVLRASGLLVIYDFYSPTLKVVDNHHFPGLKTYKRDWRELFPAYACTTHKVGDHRTGEPTDNPDDWVAVSVLRKP